MAHHVDPERYATPSDIGRKTRQWLAEIVELNRPVVLGRDRSALLVIDM